MARILGLDVGERRIGIAISAPEGRLAVPLRVLNRRDEDADIAAIAELARSEQVEAVVVGHPLSLSGAAGPQATRVEVFARRLAESTGLSLDLWDERLSSVQAERVPAPTKRGRRRPRDDLAAAIILQSYLDRHRPEAPSPADA
jgi:putative Holliday junction resolvase